MLANKGEINGLRILKEETVDIMTSDNLPEGVTFNADKGMGYGLGASVTPAKGLYSWGGMAATFFWVDVKNNMAIVVLAQHLPQQKYPFAYEFKNLVYKSLVK